MREGSWIAGRKTWFLVLLSAFPFPLSALSTTCCSLANRFDSRSSECVGEAARNACNGKIQERRKRALSKNITIA